MRTPAEAKSLLCPFARTFIQAGPTSLADAGCKGPACALWRWETITTKHPLWADAVKAEAEKIDEKAPFPKASKIVADNLEAYNLVPKTGHCGAGGQP